MAVQEMTQRYPAAVFGGKGAALLQLREAGFPVPPFTILEAGRGTAFTDPAARETLRRHMEDAFGSESPFEARRYAVRSSAASEDGSEQSFAGQFETVLDVAWEDLPQAVSAVLQSAASARVQAYSGGNAPAGMAVVIQEMVPATVSGVVFGAHPVSGEDVIVVNAVAGIGEALVGGQVTGEEYLLRKSGALLTAPPDGLLNAGQLAQLAACVQSLEAHFGTPQDAEFAFAGDAFFLLQARPITTVGSERIVWDNANIVESYPGLTLPLTFSFIEKMYAAVYRQFSLVLGVAPKRVRAAENVYRNMLGLLNGRVYYNLNSWYRALAQLPGYSLNAGFMEKMMGVKDKPDIDLGAAPQEGKLSGWFGVLRALTAITGNLRGARKGREAFESAFNRVHRQFAAKSYAGAALNDIWKDYSAFEALMVREWKAPLVNDFFAMVYFGLLQKQCARLFPEDATLHNRLLAASGDVATTAPLKRLPALAAAFAASPALKEALLQAPPEAVLELLAQSPHENVRHEFERYLADWGERVAEELKLETVSYTDDPRMLLAVLKNYVASELFAVPEENDSDRREAEAKVEAALRRSPLRRRLFGHILRQARYFVANRENLRYYRTRGFAAVRRMMLAAGTTLAAKGALENARDVFYLRLEELDGLVKETLPLSDLKPLVDIRKSAYRRFAGERLPARITTWGIPKEIAVARETEAPLAAGTGVLQGLPCSPGVVRARVRKVVSVTGHDSLERAILATYATDPGYVVLFPSAAGILTERGSLLSHAAIVSREMNIPCIVGIEGLMAALEDGDQIEMDGSTGLVRILKQS